jgi:hypothetical protein
LIYIPLANQTIHHIPYFLYSAKEILIIEKYQNIITKYNQTIPIKKGASMMFTREFKKHSSKKHLKEELVNLKLFDNHSFQFIFVRELQKRMKAQNFKQDQNFK